MRHNTASQDKKTHALLPVKSSIAGEKNRLVAKTSDRKPPKMISNKLGSIEEEKREARQILGGSSERSKKRPHVQSHYAKGEKKPDCGASRLRSNVSATTAKTKQDVAVSSTARSRLHAAGTDRIQIRGLSGVRKPTEQHKTKNKLAGMESQVPETVENGGSKVSTPDPKIAHPNKLRSKP